MLKRPEHERLPDEELPAIDATFAALMASMFGCEAWGAWFKIETIDGVYKHRCPCCGKLYVMHMALGDHVDRVHWKPSEARPVR